MNHFSDPPPRTPEELIEQLVEQGPGWRAAFGELVRLNDGWVRGYLRSRIRDWAAADDLAQDVFVTAFRRIKTYSNTSSFEGWLRGIAVNHLRNFQRKRREECVGSMEELQSLIERSTNDFLGSNNESAALEALHKCLAPIDGPLRDLLKQRYVAGKTIREISEENDKSPSAVSMQLHRLKQALADCVKRRMEVTES